MNAIRRKSTKLAAVWCALVLLVFGFSGTTGNAASPLSGQQTGERLDRRKGDRQLQERIDSPRLHREMRPDDAMIQPQARPRIRVREWDEQRAPSPERTEDPSIRRRRRIGVILD